MDTQVYTPATITDTPFPQDDTQIVTPSQTANATVTTQSTTPDALLPVPQVANDLIGQTLNTQSKKILQEFGFTQSGAIQIGDYTLGQSGDVRIDPNGIVARNISGNTTFALDGDDGSAVFAGTLQAGTLIGGDNTVIVEKGPKGGGRITFYDAEGNPTIVIGDL